MCVCCGGGGYYQRCLVVLFHNLMNLVHFECFPKDRYRGGLFHTPKIDSFIINIGNIRVLLLPNVIHLSRTARQ